VRAQDRGLIDERPEAAIDATGRESQHTSSYFFKRAGKKPSARLWTKLTVVCDTGSHFFTAATVSTGPRTDAPPFAPALNQAALIVSWDGVLGDAAFDSEESHRLCREKLGVRSTVMPLNRRSHPLHSGVLGPRQTNHDGNLHASQHPPVEGDPQRLSSVLEVEAA
jgi:hypothetical protein